MTVRLAWIRMAGACVAMVCVCSCGVDRHQRVLAPFDQLNHAVLRGDIKLLPDCRGDKCAPAMKWLVKATAARINWKLADSLAMSQHCEALSRKSGVTSVVNLTINYACARLVNQNATNLRGFDGNVETIGMLAASFEQLYRNHVPGTDGTPLKNAIIRESRRLAGVGVLPERVVHDGTARAVELAAAPGADASKVVTKNPAFPLVHVNINGKILTLLMDTGVGSTVLSSSAAKKVGANYVAGAVSMNADIEGRVAPSAVATVASLSFAGVTINNESVDVAESAGGGPYDGILGLDVLDKIGSFELTPTQFIANPVFPNGCAKDITMVTDFGGPMALISIPGVRFNGSPVVAILDTGNSISDVMPTLQFAQRFGLKASGGDVDINIRGNNGIYALKTMAVKGSVDLFGDSRERTMIVAASYPDKAIDLNVGMPYFRGKDLYVDLRRMVMCVTPDVRLAGKKKGVEFEVSTP